MAPNFLHKLSEHSHPKFINHQNQVWPTFVNGFGFVDEFVEGKLEVLKKVFLAFKHKEVGVVLEKGVADCFVNGDAGEGFGLDFAEFFSELIEKFFVLIGLGVGFLVLEKLIEIDKIGVIEKIRVKNFSIDIFEKIILAFFLKAFQSKEKLNAKESFHFFPSGLDSLVERVDLMKILDGLWVFDGFGAVLVEKVGIEFGRVELVGE